MNITDTDIRNGLNSYADTIHSTPPPLDNITTTPATPLQAGTRRRHRPILVGVTAAGVLLGAGAVAASGVFSSDTTSFVTNECDLNMNDARVVASGTDSQDNNVEFSVINSPQGDASLLAVIDPTNQNSYEAVGCGPEPGGTQLPAGQPWANASSTTINGEATYLNLSGWAPDGAVDAVITLNDGTQVEVQPQPDGYFLELVTIAPDAGIDISNIAARADDGTIIAEHKKP